MKPIADSPFANVIAFSAFWALQVFVSKLAFNHGADVLPFSVQSTVLSVIFISLYVFAMKQNELRNVPRSVIPALVAASAIHGGFGGFLANAGVALTSAINAAFLLQFSTVTTAILAWAVLKERMTTSKAITVVVIMVGTLLLVTKGHLDPPHIGDILIIGACLCWSMGNVLIRLVLRTHRLDGDVVTLFRPLCGLPVMLFFVATAPLYPGRVQRSLEGNYFDLSHLGLTALAALLAVLLWVFLNRTLRIASASYMTMMSSLTPILVAVLALIFLHDSLALIQWAGAILIIGSSYVTQIQRVAEH
jgi:drug/metabolite transporter (DMT)-like permease